jgi:hypothetical protein
MMLKKMWTAMEAYQPFADKRGFGKEWRRMCEKRTEDASFAAGWAADAAGMTRVAYAAEAAGMSRSALAIKYIDKAISLAKAK